MPLETAIIRDGEPLILKWGGFHVVAMIYAASWDSGEGPFEDNSEPPMVEQEYDGVQIMGHWIQAQSSAWRLMDYGVIGMTPMWGHDGYELKHSYKFVDCNDGEILQLQPGDKLVAYRSHKN